MGVSLEVRKERFSRLVRRTLQDAGRTGMTIPDIVEATGVSKSTLYRWRDGDWTRDPRPTEVRAFFETLIGTVAPAHLALDWASPEAGVAAEPPPPLDPEIRKILQKMNDPNVPESEKQFLRESLRMLANRGATRSSANGRQAG